MTKPGWENIRSEFEKTEITMKDLAEKHGVKASTLRSRKTREGWERNATQQPKKKVATQRNKKKNVATQKAIEQLNENSDLTEKQKQFCLLYLKYFNATKAYQEAYEVDYKTADAIAYRLLGKDGIKEELDRLKKAQRSDMYIDSLDIKREWMKQAFSDITDYVEFGPENREMLNEDTDEVETRKYSFVQLKPSTEIDGTLVQEVKQGRDGVTLRLYDKQKALQELMKLLAESGSDSGTITIVDEWSDGDE